LKAYPKGIDDANGKTGAGFLSVYLGVADDAASLPSGWSHHADFSLTLVSQTDEKYNVKMTTSQTFKAGKEVNWGYTQFLELATLNSKSKGYIVNDTLIIKCDMTNISSDALTTAQWTTRIVDADTAAAAVIIAAFPGALPAAAAAIAAVNPGAAPGAAPRVAVPAGMYPTGAGGLLYLHPGAQVND